MPTTVPQAKNAIARALKAILGEYPDSHVIEALWEHFENQCAYCGKAISQGSRDSSLDHLVPSASGGSNQAANLALACSDCNDTRRDLPWYPFLESVCEPERASDRAGRIERWIEMHGGARLQVNDELHALAKPHISAVLEACGRAKQALRDIRDGTT